MFIYLCVKIIYEAIITAVNNNNQFVPKCFFIDGIGGCGKTFLLNVTILIISYLSYFYLVHC